MRFGRKLLCTAPLACLDITELRVVAPSVKKMDKKLDALLAFLQTMRPIASCVFPGGI